MDSACSAPPNRASQTLNASIVSEMRENRLWALALLFLASALYARWHGWIRPNVFQDDIGITARDEGEKRVVIGPTGLLYYEGDNMLRLTVEMADGRGVDYIVYVWSPSSWVREMPDWCRHRREEVLPEIKRLTADKRIMWVEEE